jgi:hypothetical protein
VSLVSVLMFKCPNTGRELSTGIEMDAATFEQLPDIHSHLKCPVCSLDHIWSTSFDALMSAIDPERTSASLGDSYTGMWVLPAMPCSMQNISAS